MEHLYTLKEVVAYVTLAACMSFSVGFLIAAYTRIFKDDEHVSKKNILVRSKFPE